MDCGKLLYEQIVEDITERIRVGTLAVGDSIDPVQQLRREYGVSHITILRVLRELSGGGVIRKSGRRYQVAGPVALPETKTLGGRNSTLGVFVRPLRENESDNYFNEINFALEREISMARMNYLRCHYACVFNFIPPNEEGEYDRTGEMLGQMLAAADRVCGMLVDERVSDRVLREFVRQSQVPVVVVNRLPPCGVDGVGLPNRECVEMLLNKILLAGYRDVFFCGSTYMRYSNDYVRYLALRELAELPQYRELTVHWYTDLNQSMIQYTTELKAAMKKASRPFLMASVDQLAIELVSLMESEDFRCPRDFGCCGFYAFPPVLADGRRVSSVKINTRAMGELAVKLLLKRIQYPWNSGKEELQVPVEFIHGDTM